MLESIVRNIESGADAAEIDLHATKDGKIIIQHDDDLKLNDGSLIKISSCTLEELQDAVLKGLLDPSLCDANPGTVHDILDYIKSAGKLVNADLKADASIDPFLDIVRDHAMESSIIISGCEDERARMVTDRKPAVQVLLNEDVYRQGLLPPYPEKRLPDLFYRIRTLGCGAVNIQYLYCNEAFVEYFRKRYIAIAVWTVDQEEHMQSCIQLGVNSITTNRVEPLVRMIRKSCIPIRIKD